MKVSVGKQAAYLNMSWAGGLFAAAAQVGPFSSRQPGLQPPCQAPACSHSHCCLDRCFLYSTGGMEALILFISSSKCGVGTDVVVWSKGPVAVLPAPAFAWPGRAWVRWSLGQS